jgi:hypothetical protein
MQIDKPKEFPITATSIDDTFNTLKTNMYDFTAEKIRSIRFDRNAENYNLDKSLPFE